MELKQHGEPAYAMGKEASHDISANAPSSQRSLYYAIHIANSLQELTLRINGSSF